MGRTRAAPATSRFVVFAGICLAIAVLYVAQAVLVPLVLAILLSLLLAPVSTWLERRRIPRIPSLVLTVGASFLLIGGVGWMVGRQVVDLAETVPVYRNEIASKLRTLRGAGGGIAQKIEKISSEIEKASAPTSRPTSRPSSRPSTRPSAAHIAPPWIRAQLPVPAPPPPEPQPQPEPSDRRPAGTQSDPLYAIPLPEPSSPVSTLGGYVTRMLDPLGTACVVVVLVFFMLLEREELRDRLIRIVSHGQLTLTTTALDDALRRITGFMKAQTLINGCYGIAVAACLWTIGMTLGGGTPFPNWLLWGLMAAALRFVPYIGAWIASAFPLAIALAAFPGFTVFTVTAVCLATLEFWNVNVMEPWLYGSRTGLSTIAVLASAIFWTWLWGPVGLLLATPMTVCMVVLAKHIPQLQFLHVLLGNAPALQVHERIYQRLLARDLDEATRVIDELSATHTPLEVFDQGLLPALALAERDRERGLLDRKRDRYARAGMRQLAHHVGDALEPPEPSSQDRPTVLCLPAHDDADDIALLMLQQALRAAGCRVQVASHDTLRAEMLQMITAHQPAVVCVSAMPPGALSHARRLLRRLRDRYPPARVLVAVWTSTLPPDALRQRLGAVLPTVATSLASAVDRILQIAREQPPTAESPSASHNSHAGMGLGSRPESAPPAPTENDDARI